MHRLKLLCKGSLETDNRKGSVLKLIKLCCRFSSNCAMSPIDSINDMKTQVNVGS